MSVVWLLPERSQGYLRLPPTSSVSSFIPAYITLTVTSLLKTISCHVSQNSLLFWILLLLPPKHPFHHAQLHCNFPTGTSRGSLWRGSPSLQPNTVFSQISNRAIFLFSNTPPWPSPAGDTFHSLASHNKTFHALTLVVPQPCWTACTSILLLPAICMCVCVLPLQMVLPASSRSTAGLPT